MPQKSRALRSERSNPADRPVPKSQAGFRSIRERWARPSLLREGVTSAPRHAGTPEAPAARSSRTAGP